MNQTLKAAYRQTAGRVPRLGDVDRAIVTARRRRTRRAVGVPIAVASLAAVISVAAMTTPWSDDAETQPAVVESPSTSPAPSVQASQPSPDAQPRPVVRVKPGSFGTTYWRLFEAAADETWKPTVIENGKLGSGPRWFRMSGFFHGAWVEVNVVEQTRAEATHDEPSFRVYRRFEGHALTVQATDDKVWVLADLDPCEPPGCRGEGLVLTPDVKLWFVSDVKAMLQFGPPKRPW
jgi:hypothetical protein